MTIDQWGTQTRDVVTSVWDRIVDFAPNLVGAIVIVAVGAVIGMVLGYVITRLFQAIRLQSLSDQSKFTATLKKARLNPQLLYPEPLPSPLKICLCPRRIYHSW